MWEPDCHCFSNVLATTSRLHKSSLVSLVTSDCFCIPPNLQRLITSIFSEVFNVFWIFSVLWLDPCSPTSFFSDFLLFYNFSNVLMFPKLFPAFQTSLTSSLFLDFFNGFLFLPCLPNFSMFSAIFSLRRLSECLSTSSILHYVLITQLPQYSPNSLLSSTCNNVFQPLQRSPPP